MLRFRGACAWGHTGVCLIGKYLKFLGIYSVGTHWTVAHLVSAAYFCVKNTILL